jgi:hypothetical protein
MPSRPDFSQHRPDPRFDRYRNRVGWLLRGPDEVGLVLVAVEPYAMQVSGHLWWKRWGSTRDWLFEWTVVDGNFSDTLVPEDAADKVLADYDSGRFDYYGEVMRVVWTDASESERLRSLEFGM